MTIKELKDELENYEEELEVRLAIAPNYPMEYSIGDIRDYESENDDKERKVYICEGREIGYLSKEVFG